MFLLNTPHNGVKIKTWSLQKSSDKCNIQTKFAEFTFVFLLIWLLYDGVSIVTALDLGGKIWYKIVNHPASYVRINIYLPESLLIPGRGARKIRTYLGTLYVENNELILNAKAKTQILEAFES